MQKKLIIFVIALLLSVAVLLHGGNKAEATWDFDICEIIQCDLSVTPSVEPSVEPSIEVSPSVDVSPSAEASPSVELTPTVEPTAVPQSPHGDGLSDGHESGHANAPNAPPATGRG